MPPMDNEYWYGYAAYAAWQHYQKIQFAIGVIQNLIQDLAAETQPGSQ